jgi:sulfur-carrier protein
VSVTVRIPTPLRTVTGGNATVDADGSTVGEVLKSLDAAYPGIGERVLDGAGKVRRFVNIFLDDQDIRFAQGLDTPVREGTTISIIPAVAGG